MRRITRRVKVGNLDIGGDSNITVQSMTNTDTRNVEATLNQIKELASNGCDIVRLAVLDLEACEAIGKITKETKVPIVADIHFDYKLALECAKMGVAKVRINPGNIGSKEKVKLVADALKAKDIPIRIGVNSGSLEKDIYEKYGGATPEALVESAMRHVEMLEDLNFRDIVISIKSSNVVSTVESYRLLKKECNYPFHIGVTEAGTLFRGTIKSAVGIGTLLMEGIGDTLRVSLTSDPVEEVKVGREILRSTGYLKDGIEFVSCPTCGRTQIDLIGIAKEVEEKLKDVKKEIKVAVMGCVVNGPGEAKDADIGIAGGNGMGLIFKKGVVVRTVKEKDLVNALLEEIESI